MPNLIDLLREGLGFAPTPEDIAKYKAIEQTITPESEVLTGDPGGPAGQAGLVLTPRNAERLAEMWKKMGATEGVQGAINFLRAKYPKLSSIPKAMREAPKEVLPDDLGRYMLESKDVLLSDMLNRLPFKRAVEVGGHELTHAARDRKGALEALRYSFTPADEARFGYEEILARRGGQTAKEAIDKLLLLLGQR